MARTLKVYGWIGFRNWRPEGDHRSPQTREIVAATSMREVARLAGETGPNRLSNLSETGNDAEIRTAMAEPGVIFWKGLDQPRDDHWQRG